MNRRLLSILLSSVVFLSTLSIPAFAAAPQPGGKGTVMLAHHYGLAFAGIGVDNPPDITGVQLGLHCMARDAAGVQMGIGSSARRMSGLQFSLAASMTSERLNGMQFALAITEAEQGMDGLQLSFFRSSVGNHVCKDKHGNRIEPEHTTTSSGVQFSICGTYAENLNGIQLAFWDAYAQDLDGIQISVLHTAERFSGIQAGLWNNAGIEGHHATGLQLGLVNTSDDFSGLQLGLLNRSKKLKGIQIGLVNICDSSSMPVLPILNASF